MGIRPSTMNAARRSTHNPRTQHQRCVPLHVRHGGPHTFWTETSWWNTMVFALCGEAHGPHMRKQVLNTSWVLYRENKTTIRRVDSTQAAFQRNRTRCSYSMRQLVLRYHLFFFFSKKYLCRTDSWHCAEWKHEHHQST